MSEPKVVSFFSAAAIKAFLFRSGEACAKEPIYGTGANRRLPGGRSFDVRVSGDGGLCLTEMVPNGWMSFPIEGSQFVRFEPEPRLNAFLGSPSAFFSEVRRLGIPETNLVRVARGGSRHRSPDDVSESVLKLVSSDVWHAV